MDDVEGRLAIAQPVVIEAGRIASARDAGCQRRGGRVGKLPIVRTSRSNSSASIGR